MHDLHMAQRIMEVVKQNAKKHSLEKVTKVSVGIGRVVEHGEQIFPENLKFNLQLLAAGSVAEKAKFHVYQMDGNSFVVKDMEGLTAKEVREMEGK